MIGTISPVRVDISRLMEEMTSPSVVQESKSRRLTYHQGLVTKALQAGSGKVHYSSNLQDARYLSAMLQDQKQGPAYSIFVAISHFSMQSVTSSP